MEIRRSLIPRITRGLAEWMDSLSSVPVFYEEMQPAGSSSFDEELNHRVKEKALRHVEES